MNEFFEVENLSKYFPIYSGVFKRQAGLVKAVDNISFKLNPGEVLGIVGESGCGKSTLGRAAIFLIEPTCGDVKFQSVSLKHQSKEHLRRIRKDLQIIFQDPYSSLNPRKTIFESLAEPLAFHGIAPTWQEQHDLVVKTLKRIGLSEDVMERYPHEFSGGQQQRICIGRAISLNPKLIVCDEPVSALDISVQAQILNLLTHLKTKLDLSYIFISHDLSVVRTLCDRVIVMYLGKIMEEARIEDLFKNPKHPYTQALLSAEPKRHPLEEKKRIILNGELPSAADPPSGCPFRLRCPYAQPICAKAPPKKNVMGEEGHNYFCVL